MKKKYYFFIIIIICIFLLISTILLIVKKRENTNNNSEIKENFSNVSLEENTLENNNINYKILGTYNAKRPDGTEAFTYIFSENSVIFASDTYNDGTYIIDGNKIKITYSVTHSPVDNSPMDFVRNPEELIIEDDNTLINKDGTKFYKTSEKTTLE